MESKQSDISLESIPAAIILFKANTFTDQDKQVFLTALTTYTTALLDTPDFNENPFHFSLMTMQQMGLSVNLESLEPVYLKHILYLLKYIPTASYTDVHVINTEHHYSLYESPPLDQNKWNVEDSEFLQLVREWFLNPLSKTFLVVPLIEVATGSLSTHAVLAVLKKSRRGIVRVMYLDSQGADPKWSLQFQNIMQRVIPEAAIKIMFKCPQVQESNIDCHQWQMMFVFLFLLSPAEFENNLLFLKTSYQTPTNINIIVFQMFMFFILISFCKYDIGDIYFHSLRNDLLNNVTLRGLYTASDQRLRETVQQLFSITDCSEGLNESDCAQLPNCTYCEPLCLNNEVVKQTSGSTGCQPASIKDVLKKMFKCHYYLTKRGLLPVPLSDIDPNVYKNNLRIFNL